MLKGSTIVLGLVLNTCFEWMKTTSPSRQNIPKHTSFSLQSISGELRKVEVPSFPSLTAKLTFLGLMICFRFFPEVGIEAMALSIYDAGCRTALASPGLLNSLDKLMICTDIIQREFVCLVVHPSIRLRVPPPPCILKRGGLEISGQRLIFLNGKTKRIKKNPFW